MSVIHTIHNPTSNPIKKLPPLILKQNTPKKIKQLLLQISKSSPQYFNENILSSQNCLDIFQQIAVWTNLKAFYLQKILNQQQKILHSIAKISFPKLTQLYLQNIQLNNFQALEWINCPNLQMIYLMKNNSHNIKALSKTCFGLISKIQLDNNIPKSQLSLLSRMKMSNKCQIIFQLQLRKEKQNQRISDKTLMKAWLFKLESKRIHDGISKNQISEKQLKIKTGQLTEVQN